MAWDGAAVTMSPNCSLVGGRVLGFAKNSDFSYSLWVIFLKQLKQKLFPVWVILWLILRWLLFGEDGPAMWV